MIGICSYGAYVPLYRLARQIMVLEGKGGAGERAVAGADEDSLTMSMDAILDCTKGIDRASVDGLLAASTRTPEASRRNRWGELRLLSAPGEPSRFGS